ncbi:MAG: DUF3592 domain-containing protein [Phycisphaerales bacterium]|nr:DUF3592 domain-containing protein [Phycisphaerales bacterium]
MSTFSRLTGLLVALALLIGAAVADFYLISKALDEHASSRWPQVTGTITASTASAYRSKNARRYRPAVTYTYDFDGETRTGRVITIGESRGPSFRSEKSALELYPVGTQVPVFVDPASPSNAALVVGMQRKTVAFLFFVGVLNAVAAIMLRPSIRSFAFRAEPIRYYLMEDSPQRAVLRLAQMTATEFGFLWGGIASAVVGVAMLLVPGPVLTVAAAGLAVVAFVCVLGFLRRRSTLAAGRHDVVVDRGSGLMTLPPSWTEAAGPTIDMAMVDRVEVRASQASTKNNQSTAEVAVHAAEWDEPRVTARWMTLDEAAVIAGWLRQELQLDEGDLVVSVQEEDEADESAD